MPIQAQQSLPILVVDDNPVNLKMLETALAKEGYPVLTASNGKEGRKLAIESQPALILLDIRMPGEDGFQVIQHLKGHAETTSIPVIFLTGVSEVDAKLTGFELGAVDYITKPFHPQEVVARVRLHLKLSIATNSLISNQADKLRQITEAQVALLTTPADMPDANFGVHYQALQEAGGDFYDVLRITSDIFGYFIADFSGHDISTSYLTASVKALLSQNCTPVYRPEESMKMINDVLVEILPDGKYLTACYARLNRKTHQMTIINAGHPPVVYVPATGDPLLLEMEGDILGMFRDVYFGSRTLSVKPGDRFYLYSDGLVESPEQKRIWTAGAEQLVSVCASAGTHPISSAVRMIVKEMLGPEVMLEDDAVLIGLEI